MNEDIITLGDAVHTFVQWPRRYIALDPAVPRSPHDHASSIEPSMTPPPPRLQKTAVSVDLVVPRSPHYHASPTEPSMAPPQPPLQKAAVSARLETMPSRLLGRRIAGEAVRLNRRTLRRLTSPRHSRSEGRWSPTHYYPTLEWVARVYMPGTCGGPTSGGQPGLPDSSSNTWRGISLMSRASSSWASKNFLNYSTSTPSTPHFYDAGHYKCVQSSSTFT